MKTFVINLDSAPHRLAHIQQAFQRLGLTFTRVPAVDGSVFGSDFMKDFSRQRPLLATWTPGIAACLLSHIDVWRRIAKGEDSICAVFEDDVHLASDLGALFASNTWIPRDADLVRLEANGAMILRNGKSIAATPGRRVYRAVSGTWGSAGYLIAKRTAQVLIDTPVEFHHAPDTFLFKPRVTPVAGKLRRYQVKPALCIQDMLLNGSASTLPSSIGSHFPTAEALQKRTNWMKRLWPRHKEAVPFRP